MQHAGAKTAAAGRRTMPSERLDRSIMAFSRAASACNGPREKKNKPLKPEFNLIDYLIGIKLYPRARMPLPLR